MMIEKLGVGKLAMNLAINRKKITRWRIFIVKFNGYVVLLYTVTYYLTVKTL